MADYIKREDAIKEIENAQIISDGENCGYCCEDISISSIPAADVRENVRGEWIGEYDGYADGNPVYDMWYCSHCGYSCEDDEPPKWNFCPNCGADMRGGEKDD